MKNNGKKNDKHDRHLGIPLEERPDDESWDGSLEAVGISVGKKKPKEKKPNTDFLKGSGVDRSVKYVDIFVENVRKVAIFEVPYTIDFEYIPETEDALAGSEASLAHSWNVNKTNAQLLALFCPTGNARTDLVGKTIRLRPGPVKNPDGIKVRGLKVEAVKVGRKWVTPAEMLEMSGEEEE